MRTYAYPAVVEPGDKAGIFVSFPDAPGAFTQGDDDADAHAMAAAAFGLMLAQYLADGKSLPEPSRQGKGQIMITAEPDLSKAGQCEGWGKTPGLG